MSKETTACFTGHRPEKICASGYPTKAYLNQIKSMLYLEILEAVRDRGYRTFVSGMARGVDLWAAAIVLNLRQQNNDVKLICAVPFEGFEARWSEDNRREYARIIEQSDLVRYICPRYSKPCFQIRNEWLVNHAARLIAVWNGQPSGTGNTVAYAQRQNVEVINIL